MGILINDIKYKSDHLYAQYETQIDKYYGTQHKYDDLSLTDYIFRFYVQLDYRSAFNRDTKSITDIHKYIEKLYYNYYNHYCKDDNREITKKVIDDLLVKNTIVKQRTAKYILQKEDIHKANIKTFIETCFKDMKSLPRDSMWEVDQIDLHVFLAQLVDFFIETHNELNA